MHFALSEETESGKERFGDGNIIGSNRQEQWKKALTSCFLKVDCEVAGSGRGDQGVAPETVGSTSVVAIVLPTQIVVANCGDSRAVLCRGKLPMPLSVDHKVRLLQNLLTRIDVCCINSNENIYIYTYLFIARQRG